MVRWVQGLVGYGVWFGSIGIQFDTGDGHYLSM